MPGVKPPPLPDAPFEPSSGSSGAGVGAGAGFGAGSGSGAGSGAGAGSGSGAGSDLGGLDRCGQQILFVIARMRF